MTLSHGVPPLRVGSRRVWAPGAALSLLTQAGIHRRARYREQRIRTHFVSTPARLAGLCADRSRGCFYEEVWA